MRTSTAGQEILRDRCHNCAVRRRTLGKVQYSALNRRKKKLHRDAEIDRIKSAESNGTDSGEEDDGQMKGRRGGGGGGGELILSSYNYSSKVGVIVT